MSISFVGAGALTWVSARAKLMGKAWIDKVKTPFYHPHSAAPGGMRSLEGLPSG